MTEKKVTKTCRFCGNLLAGQTIITIEFGRTQICAQCWQDWNEMSADIQDQIEEQEEAKGRWDTD